MDGGTEIVRDKRDKAGKSQTGSGVSGVPVLHKGL
jgi:hypothetical protein